MADLEGMMKEFSDTMKTVGATQVVSDFIRSYDNYAVAAMQALIQRASPGVAPDDFSGVTARFAWEIADAMMAERKKRGIGGV